MLVWLWIYVFKFVKSEIRSSKSAVSHKRQVRTDWWVYLFRDLLNRPVKSKTGSIVWQFIFISLEWIFQKFFHKVFVTSHLDQRNKNVKKVKFLLRFWLNLIRYFQHSLKCIFILLFLKFIEQTLKNLFVILFTYYFFE